MKGLYRYFQNIWARRYFWLSLVQVDLRARYRGSLVGIGWSLLHPIAMTTILCGVFCTIFHQTIADFAPYLMAGLTYWIFITTTSIQGAECFFTGESYIRQHPAPMAIYPLRTMLGAAFHFLMGYLLVIVVSLMFNGITFIGVTALLSLIPTLILLTTFGWALSILFGLATVRFRDFKHLSEIGFQALFYLTPIMYGPKQMDAIMEPPDGELGLRAQPVRADPGPAPPAGRQGNAAVADELPDRDAPRPDDGRRGGPGDARGRAQNHLQPVTRGFPETWRESS